MTYLNVALLAPLLSRASGGLASSVPNLARYLDKLDGVSVNVLGVEDPDAPEEAEEWGPSVKARCLRAPRKLFHAPGLLEDLRAISPDVVDVQGLWTYPSLVSLRHHRRTGTPYLVTPRGMLDPWALQNSKWRKLLARMWFEDAHLHQATCLRATAEMEAEHFRSFGLRNPVAIVPNGIDVPDLSPREKKSRRRVLFLSRIHPKKGISFLLQAWARLESQKPEWELIIAGPEEVGHEVEMKALSKKLGLTRVRFIGPVHGAEKDHLYRSADLFVLPTRAENFGLVVAEALAREVPVITTQNAPWEELKVHGCGWWIALEQGALESAMAEAMAKTAVELHTMGAKGRAWMKREFGWDGVTKNMLEVYEWVAKGGPRPSTIVT